MREWIIILIAVLLLLGCTPRNQINENTERMKENQDKERYRMKMADLDTFCDNQCSKAHRSPQDQINYCLSYYRETIDINQNNKIDFSTELDFLNGYCEDRICCCVYRPYGKLDFSGCLEKVDKSRFEPGDCYEKLGVADKEKHWFSDVVSE